MYTTFEIVLNADVVYEGPHNINDNHGNPYDNSNSRYEGPTCP